MAQTLEKSDQTTDQTMAAPVVADGPFISETNTMLGMGIALMEAVGDMNAEFIGFVADRIKEDVKTQHQMFHCKTAADLQHVQAQFIQTAMEQYQVETCKLVALGNKALETDGEG